MVSQIVLLHAINVILYRTLKHISTAIGKSQNIYIFLRKLEKLFNVYRQHLSIILYLGIFCFADFGDSVLIVLEMQLFRVICP